MAYYSDKPRKHSGISIKPRWDWSREYAQWAANQTRALFRSDPAYAEARMKDREHAYYCWVEKTRGTDAAAAMMKEHRMQESRA